MGKVYASIDAKLANWIERQRMYFVATAPLAGDGHVNVSPKGHDTLRILGPSTLAFVDYGGSGIETVAHVRENGRIVIMMCAFDGPPKIFRFHGEGRVVTPNAAEFSELRAHFDGSRLGARTIIVVDVTRVADSCGYGVPLFDFVDQRSTSEDYMKENGAAKIGRYLVKHNTVSIDGLPGLTEEEALAFAPPGD